MHVHGGARVGEFDVPPFGGGAAVSDVGNEHVREGTVSLGVLWFLDGRLGFICCWLGVSLLRCGSDRYGSTVHVHFAVADPVEPCPSQYVISRLNAIGDCILKFTGALIIGIATQIPIEAVGAVPFNRVNHLPFRVLCGILVGG